MTNIRVAIAAKGSVYEFWYFDGNGKETVVTGSPEKVIQMLTEKQYSSFLTKNIRGFTVNKKRFERTFSLQPIISNYIGKTF